jgi:hypothetical protein
MGFNTGGSSMIYRKHQFQTVKPPRCRKLLEGIEVARTIVRHHQMIEKGPLMRMVRERLRVEMWEANRIINAAVETGRISKVKMANEVRKWEENHGRGRKPSWYIAGPTLKEYKRERPAGSRATLKPAHRFSVD